MKPYSKGQKMYVDIISEVDGSNMTEHENVVKNNYIKE